MVSTGSLHIVILGLGKPACTGRDVIGRRQNVNLSLASRVQTSSSPPPHRRRHCVRACVCVCALVCAFPFLSVRVCICMCVCVCDSVGEALHTRMCRPSSSHQGTRMHSSVCPCTCNCPRPPSECNDPFAGTSSGVLGTDAYHPNSKIID